MPADLTGVKRRIAHAQRDLDALRDEVAAYMEPSPYRVVVERDGDSEAIRTYIDREPDPDWAIKFGSVGVQARTALDHLVFQLVIDSDNPVSKRTRTQFPIFENEGDYREHRERMLKGVASRHRKVIARLQPYHRGKRAFEDPLAILATITNRDKHREDHVVLAGAGRATYRLDRSLIQPPVEDLTITIDRGPHESQRITDGGVLFGIENQPSPEAPDEKIKLELDDLHAVLLFEGDRPVSLDDLSRAVTHASEIVERFSNRIKP
ncbi:MAG: hypothetical protein WBM00_08285 [Solirubrobacterales bacterium]